MKNIKRPALTLIAALLGGASLTACSSFDTNVDERTIEIESYMVVKTDKKLVDCHEPGKAGFGGWGNEMVTYPAGQRTYSFTGAENAESSPISVVSAEDTTVAVPGYVTFTLTDDCKDLYDFHKKVGVKFKASESEGWAKLLSTYFNTAVTSSLNDVASSKPWKQIYSDASVRKEMEKALSTNLEERIANGIGGNWFKINKVTLSKPTVSGDLRASLESAEQAKLDDLAQRQRNTVASTKYDSLKTCKGKGLSENSCLTIHLAEEGKVDLLPVPAEGGSIIVNKGK